MNKDVLTLTPVGQPQISDCQDNQSLSSNPVELNCNLLEVLPDASAIIDFDGKIIFVNQRTVAMFGYQSGELLGQPIEILMPVRFHENHIRSREQYVVKPHARSMGRGLDIIGMRKDGSEFPVDISLSPIQIEGGRVIFASIRDISDHKDSEARIQRLNSELARSNVDLDQFAAIVAHDLKEPLRMITSYISLLEMRCAEMFDDRARECLERVSNGGKRMRCLIDGILAYSQLGHQAADAADVATIDSSAAVRDTIANLQVAITSGQATIIYDSLPQVLANREQLAQLFQNLIGNGLKYCSSLRKPVVHITAQESDSEWTFAVADNGIGMEPAHFEKIFQIFERVHTDRFIRGSGIGLAICKKIVERHRGRIWVESTIDVGSTFFFTLPK